MLWKIKKGDFLLKEKKIYRVRVEIVTLLILVPLVLVLGAVLSSWPQDAEESKPAVAGEARQVVTLNIQGPGEVMVYEVAVEGEATVREVLEGAVVRSGLLLDVKDYGEELGIFVEAINGVAGDAGRGTYWHLYINDVLSPVGASTAKVMPGDRITWKYEKQHEEN
ncbi:MAG: DUF4430 domain-containing protein [bacterium]